MSKQLKRFQARARELARSGKFYGCPPLEFELGFEEGFSEAREWLYSAATARSRLMLRSLGRAGGLLWVAAISRASF